MGLIDTAPEGYGVGMVGFQKALFFNGLLNHRKKAAHGSGRETIELILIVYGLIVFAFPIVLACRLKAEVNSGCSDCAFASSARHSTGPKSSWLNKPTCIAPTSAAWSVENEMFPS